ncbi:putative reverse transcriptase domain-containing protein [Tanacetum coccineum]
MDKDCRGVPRNVNPVSAKNLTVRACYECGSTDHVRGNQARVGHTCWMKKQRKLAKNPNIVTLALEPSELGFRYEIEIASGQLVEIDKVIKGCKLEIEGHVFDIYLIPFRHRSFDVIIGMDWLSNHKAKIIYHEKVVKIPLLDGKVLRVLGEKLEEKMRLPLVREIEFRIELIPGATPVANSPYRLAPSELEEFSGQLKELQDKVIMEYLVNISKRRTFWSLNEDILKITILKTNTPYPSRKIRRIRACTHQRPQRNKAQYAIRIDDDLHDLRSVEAEFPAIVINDAFAPPGCTSVQILNFENEFPDIVYNDARTSKSDYLTEQTLSPRHNNESDLNDETSLSKYNVVGQNILYFNDLFPFNIIHPNDLKSDEDNDNNEIYIIQSSEEAKGLEYTDADITDFEERLDRIYSREIHRVQVMDFLGMPELMRDGLFSRMVMEQRDDVGVVLFTSRAWGRLFDTKGPLVRELILEFLNSLDLERDPVLRLCHQMMAHSIARRSQAPEKPDILGFAAGRKSGASYHWLQICMEVDDTWAWVAMRPERQPDAVAWHHYHQLYLGQAQRWPELKEDAHEIHGALTEQREVIDTMARDFSRFSTWAITRLAWMIDKAGVTYVPYSETHVPYQRRRVRQRTGEASTSAAQQDPQQPDP